MRLTTRHVLTGVLWLGLMPPVCAAADQPGPEATLPQPTGLQATGPQATGPQATGSQGTVPQATGPQAMWQQSMAPQATAPESIPPGQPTGPTVSSAPASANGPASAPAPTATQSQAPQEDNASWYAGTFGPGCSTPPCCEICGGGSGPPPDYYVEADLRVLGRDRPKETPTITFERKSGDPSAQPTITQLFGEMSFKVINDGILSGHAGHDRPLPGTRLQQSRRVHRVYLLGLGSLARDGHDEQQRLLPRLFATGCSRRQHGQPLQFIPFRRGRFQSGQHANLVRTERSEQLGAQLSFWSPQRARSPGALSQRTLAARVPAGVVLLLFCRPAHSSK